MREALATGATGPIILLTDVGDSDLDLAAARAGPADYPDKSELSGKLLERSIRYALRRHQTVVALKEATERIELANNVVIVARRLIVLSRADDTMGRTGGNEFA